MKKRILKGTRKANTMMALAIVTTAQLTGPHAHAQIILDRTVPGGLERTVLEDGATINVINNPPYDIVRFGSSPDLEEFDATIGTLNVTSDGELNTKSLIVGDQAEGLLNVNGGIVNVVGEGFDGLTELGVYGKGTINVTNFGTLNTNSIDVGGSGEGLLNVNGGVVNVTEDVYFWSSGANASAAVTNGTLAIGGDLFLGEGLAIGLKTLDINSNGTVRVFGNLTRGSSGSVINLNTGGRLQIGNAGTTGTLLGGTGDLTNNGTLIFNRSGFYTYSGVLSGSGVVEKQGIGTLTLSGANTYAGATTVSAGILEISNALALQNSALDTSGAGSVTLLSVTPTLGGRTGGTDRA